MQTHQVTLDVSRSPELSGVTLACMQMIWPCDLKIIPSDLTNKYAVCGNETLDIFVGESLCQIIWE